MALTNRTHSPAFLQYIQRVHEKPAGWKNCSTVPSELSSSNQILFLSGPALLLVPGGLTSALHACPQQYRSIENIAQDHVQFFFHTGQGQKFFHCVRHLAVILINYLLTARFLYSLPCSCKILWSEFPAPARLISALQNLPAVLYFFKGPLPNNVHPFIGDFEPPAVWQSEAAAASCM